MEPDRGGRRGGRDGLGEPEMLWSTIGGLGCLADGRGGAGFEAVVGVAEEPLEPPVSVLSRVAASVDADGRVRFGGGPNRFGSPRAVMGRALTGDEFPLPPPLPTSDFSLSPGLGKDERSGIRLVIFSLNESIEVEK